MAARWRRVRARKPLTRGLLAHVTGPRRGSSRWRLCPRRRGQPIVRSIRRLLGVQTRHQSSISKEGGGRGSRGDHTKVYQNCPKSRSLGNPGDHCSCDVAPPASVGVEDHWREADAGVLASGGCVLELSLERLAVSQIPSGRCQRAVSGDTERRHEVTAKSQASVAGSPP